MNDDELKKLIGYQRDKHTEMFDQTNKEVLVVDRRGNEIFSQADDALVRVQRAYYQISRLG